MMSALAPLNVDATVSTVDVSIVIPVYNEAPNLRDLVDRIEASMREAGCRFELVLVDDGSRDGSQDLLRELSVDRDWLQALLLIRNYGQSTALQAGFDHARGTYIVTLDGDLQNDPADIPQLLDMLDRDPRVDVISGWRKERQDRTLSRKLPSMIANRLISRVTGVRLHDYGCALKAYRRNIIENLRLYGEQHRFIPALAAEAGARIVEVPVRHHARTRGVSKYGIDRTIRVLLDLLWVRFSMRFLHRPLHAFGTVGFALALLGGGSLGWLAFVKLFLGEDIGGRPLLFLGVLLVMIGVQLIATGVLGELLTRVYHEPQGRRQYVLRDVEPPRITQ
ncbi:MAG TPA: glycosyltransferase family 2 protein [Burkholderiaceae bacterium]|nr:glycosyltransferase family 2 protein [Burkholderiaceae bacterium]